jgi:CheY-like chemotaxis protein
MDIRTATALLVDDDNRSNQATQRRLEDDGYTVVLARDAIEGLSRAKRAVPDVIFTHLVAGGQNNVAFLQALRSDDACRHVPVIVLTGQPEFGAKHKQLRPVSRERW